MATEPVKQDGRVVPYTRLDRLWGRARRWLNFWRLQESWDGDICIEFYVRRRDATVIVTDIWKAV